jgi:hypothetical protein
MDVDLAPPSLSHRCIQLCFGEYAVGVDDLMYLVLQPRGDPRTHWLVVHDEADARGGAGCGSSAALGCRMLLRQVCVCARARAVSVCIRLFVCTLVHHDSCSVVAEAGTRAASMHGLLAYSFHFGGARVSVCGCPCGVQLHDAVYMCPPKPGTSALMPRCAIATSVADIPTSSVTMEPVLGTCAWLVYVCMPVCGALGASGCVWGGDGVCRTTLAAVELWALRGGQAPRAASWFVWTMGTNRARTSQWTLTCTRCGMCGPNPSV